ncbi:hypothetical protein Tco_0712293 [Tanacetum coccineum]
MVDEDKRWSLVEEVNKPQKLIEEAIKFEKDMCVRSGLVALNLDLAQVAELVNARLGKDVEMGYKFPLNVQGHGHASLSLPTFPNLKRLDLSLENFSKKIPISQILKRSPELEHLNIETKGLDIFCPNFHIPDDVHPQLPSPNQTIHEMLAGKIGVYTRFFEYANFRLPLSTFLVNVLRHYRINLSQLSVIAAAKVSHFEILCRVHEMDLSAFIHVADPTKVKGMYANQGDSAAGGGQDAETKLVMGVKIIAAENVMTERPKRPRKKRQAVTDASGSSHPPKKLKGDHGTSSGVTTSGKSPSVLKELLARSILNIEAVVEAVATLPLVTSFDSAMPEHESGTPADSITELNLRTIDPSKRFVISSDSSHHSSTNAAEAGIDSFIRFVAPPPVMIGAVITTNIASIPSASAPETGTKVISPVHASMFHDSDSTGTVRPDAACSSHIPGKELSMGSREINSETLHEVFVPQWNVSNDTLLDDHDVSWEFINHLAPPVLFAQIREMDYHHLERRRLESECEKQANLLKARDAEVENLKAQLLLKETKAAEAACLCAQVFAAEATKKIVVDEIDALKQMHVSLENEKDSLNGKVAELRSSVAAKDLEVKDLNVAVSSLRS